MYCSLLAAVVWATVSGCSPSEPSPLDEEKEPHYSLGRSRVNARDFSGAVDAFNEALEANPHSAAAHFQLACLFDAQVPDPAAAIFHYQEFLRLNPKADNAEVIKQRIYSCKQQLAASDMLLPSTSAAQRQMEKLAEQNRQLQAQVDHLTDLLKQWSAYCTALKNNAANTQSNPNPQPPGTSPNPDDISTGTVTNPGPTTSQSDTTTHAKPPVAKPAKSNRTHVVVAGETFASIARKQHVNLNALQAANPGVNPKKIRAGQTLNLPP